MQLLFGHVVADLVRRRRRRWAHIDMFCLATGLDPEVVARVERGGIDASLRDLMLYADALDTELTIRHDDKPEGADDIGMFRSCGLCGAMPVRHPQQHSTHVGVCLDDALFDLVENLWALRIITVASCQGTDRDDAYLVFRDVDDLRALLRLVVHDSTLANRSGLDMAGTTRWTGAVTWTTHVDEVVMRAMLRFSPGDIASMVEVTGRRLADASTGDGGATPGGHSSLPRSRGARLVDGFVQR